MILSYLITENKYKLRIINMQSIAYNSSAVIQ